MNTSTFLHLNSFFRINSKLFNFIRQFLILFILVGLGKLVFSQAGDSADDLIVNYSSDHLIRKYDTLWGATTHIEFWTNIPAYQLALGLEYNYNFPEDVVVEYNLDFNCENVESGFSGDRNVFYVTGEILEDESRFYQGMTIDVRILFSEEHVKGVSFAGFKGSIVQVDVIQGIKDPIETQTLRTSNGTTIYQDRPVELGSPPDLEGLSSGLYFLERNIKGEKPKFQKLLIR